MRFKDGRALRAIGRALSAGAGALLLANCAGTVPQLPAEASQTADGATVAPAAKTVDVAELMKPGQLGDKSFGNADAPVTIVEYASLSCPHCRLFHTETLPKLKKAYIDNGKVRLIFREFPIGHSAGTAAVAARCVSGKDYFRVVAKFFATQPAWVAQEVKTDAIYKVVQSAGLARDKFDACLANRSMSDALALVKQRGREFGVTGTPTFFVNGTKIAGAITFENLQAVIDAALAARQSAGQGGTPPPSRAEPERQAAGESVRA